MPLVASFGARVFRKVDGEAADGARVRRLRFYFVEMLGLVATGVAGYGCGKSVEGTRDLADGLMLVVMAGVSLITTFLPLSHRRVLFSRVGAVFLVAMFVGVPAVSGNLGVVLELPWGLTAGYVAAVARLLLSAWIDAMELSSATRDHPRCWCGRTEDEHLAAMRALR